MTDKKMLTLCIPTNGVLEWVFPVLDSIYMQGVDEALFEVVVTDNGKNELFEQGMREYEEKYANLIYRKTTAYEFMNQVEAFNLVNGEFVKFINHRSKLIPGKLQEMIDFVKENRDEKPVTFFSNGNLIGLGCKMEFESFDEFVRGLSYYSSWSGGLAFWSEDFDKGKIREEYNTLFPHTDILFTKRDGNKYIINNDVVFEDIPVNGISKGKYKLFNAFAVEFVSVILDLYRNGNIKIETFEKVKKENLSFVASLYFDYVIRKKECSYDVSGAKKYINIFYSTFQLNRELVGVIISRLFCKLKLK